MRKHSILIVIIASLIYGCEGPQGETGPAGASGPKLTGNIAGYVTLIDTNYNQVKDVAGVRVTLISGEPKDTAVTDVNGYWELKNIPTGIKTVTFRKEDYFFEQVENFQFIGEGTLYLDRTYLFQRPAYNIDYYGFSYDPTDSSITVMGAVKGGAAHATKIVMLCVDTSYTVGPYNGQYIFYTTISCPQNSYSFSYKFFINASFKSAYGLKTGRKLFFSMYACSPYAPNSQYDKTRGKSFPAHYIFPVGPIGIPEITVP